MLPRPVPHQDGGAHSQLSMAPSGVSPRCHPTQKGGVLHKVTLPVPGGNLYPAILQAPVGETEASHSLSSPSTQSCFPHTLMGVAPENILKGASESVSREI